MAILDRYSEDLLVGVQVEASDASVSGRHTERLTMWVGCSLGWVSGTVCLPPLVQRPKGLVDKLPLIARHRPGYLAQRG